MNEFESELELLIRKHIGTPQWNEDYQAIYNALAAAAEALALEADEYPSKEEPEWTGRRRAQ
jgi:hypothetical protein